MPTLSPLSGASQRGLRRFFACYYRLINVVGGVLLIGVAKYDLASNWEMMLAFTSQ